MSVATELRSGDGSPAAGQAAQEVVHYRDPDGLPPELRTAQDAIHLPEVQEMLQKLSAYNLGIFMPHVHDEESGQFRVPPSDIVSIEKGLQVSFQPADVLEKDPDLFLQVGWVWRQDAAGRTFAGCVKGCEKRSGDSMHYGTHK